VLQELRELGGGDDFFEELIEDFVTDAAVVLDDMAEAQRVGALTEFRDHAHALRSSAANIGALRLHKMLLNLRETSKDKLDTNGAKMMRTINSEFAQVREFFANHLGIVETLTSSISPAAE
jgi:two-component system sensor histidine kinase RpfC